MKKIKKGFTLVELIVVITILAILATISFLNFGDYPAQSRDSKRLSDLGNMEKVLTFNKIETGNFPEPENPGALEEIEGIEGIKWKKGKFGEEQFKEVKKLSSLPIDPSSNEKYDYYVSENKRFFRLEGTKETTGEKIVKTNYKEGDNAEALAEKNSTLDKEVTFTEINETLGKVTKYYKDSSTNLKWDSLSSTGLKWSLNTSDPEPVWNGSEYIFSGGETIDDYPAFKYCRDKGSKWRLPTKNELMNIISYTNRNTKGARTNHPEIRSSQYWTSTKTNHNNNYAFDVYFYSGDVTYNLTTYDYYVICLHD